jgi:hypothetical protein
MRAQEQAFRAYYSSMTDSALLAVAKNRGSFIPIAQSLVTEELRKRKLAEPPEASTETRLDPSLFTRLRRLMGREGGRGPEPVKQEPEALAPALATETEHRGSAPTDLRSSAVSVGATEDQVSMVGTVPERVNRAGTKIEDIAGTGEHDSWGG